MEKELRCPKCGHTKIKVLDIYSIEGAYIEGDNALIKRCIGECKQCHTELQWDQAYKFIRFQNISAV